MTGDAQEPLGQMGELHEIDQLIDRLREHSERAEAIARGELSPAMSFGGDGPSLADDLVHAANWLDVLVGKLEDEETGI